MSSKCSTKSLPWEMSWLVGCVVVTSYVLHEIVVSLCIRNMVHLSLYRHLARNPFFCDCRLRWLSDYLHRNPIETSGARCEAPKRMQRKRLASFREDKMKCKQGFPRVPFTLMMPIDPFSTFHVVDPYLSVFLDIICSKSKAEGWWQDCIGHCLINLF